LNPHIIYSAGIGFGQRPRAETGAFRKEEHVLSAEKNKDGIQQHQPGLDASETGRIFQNNNSL
jgi:hypothetical protein